MDGRVEVWWPIILGNTIMLIVFFGGIALCVRFDQQGKTRRRELEHAERMRAIQLNQPLDYAALARYQALGAIGVVVPIITLTAATIGSCFAFVFREPQYQFGLLAIIWLVSGLICLATLPAVLDRLRERKNQEITGGQDNPVSIPIE